MTSGPATVMGLSERQTSALRQSIQAKLQQLDTLSDETLVDYVLVLLANRHEQGKVINELEDFLSPMVVETFVEWLFGEITRAREQPDTAATSAVARPAGALKGGPLFEAALKDIPRSVGGGGPQQWSQQQQKQQERQRRAERFGMTDGEDGLLAGRPSRQRGSECRSRSPGQRRERERRRGNQYASPSPAGRRVVRATRDGLEDEEARSPGRHSRRHIIKYKSISARRAEERAVAGEDRESGRLRIKDARELISFSTRPSARGQSGRRAPNAGAAPDVAPTDTGKRTRCTFWPHCKADDACPYVHPSEPCKHFPSCVHGDKCLFIHPAIPCKFQHRCQNPTCNYMHHSPATGPRPNPPAAAAAAFSTANNPYMPPSAITCRFYPNCKNPSCPFVHPTTVGCKFGEGCRRPACPYAHPVGRTLASRSMVNAPCRYGRSCAKSDCPFQHPQTSPTGDIDTAIETMGPADPAVMATFGLGMLDDAANRAVAEVTSIMGAAQD